MTVETRSRELGHLRNPAAWRFYPLQTVKRRREGNFPEVGVVYDRGGLIESVVYLTNAFNPELESCKTIRYTNFDLMLDDGWEID